MRCKQYVPLAATVLLVAIPAFAQPQEPAQNTSQSTSKTNAQTQPAGVPDASAQPISLGDIARQARAKKQSESKPVKVLDDDNMPRGTYAADTSSAGSANGSASGQASAYTGPLPEYRGKVVLLDFWATWCGPCRSALPSIKKLQSLYGGDQFVIVSISQDDDEDEWRSFVASHGMNWPQRFDSDSTLKQRFGINVLPTYVLLGRDGSVLQRYEGESEAYSIVERVGPDLRNALGAQPKQSPQAASR